MLFSVPPQDTDPKFGFDQDQDQEMCAQQAWQELWTEQTEDERDRAFMEKILGLQDHLTNKFSNPDMNLESFLVEVSANDWFPYGTLEEALADLLLNLPRRHISETLRQLLWWIIPELCSAKGLPPPQLPSKDRLNKLHQQFQNDNIGPQTFQYTSHKGNIYHLNDIGKIISQEVANPLSSKWREELDAEFLSPSIHVRGSLFFVNEPAQLVDGSYFLPSRWFLLGSAKTLYARGLYLDPNRSGGWIIMEEEKEVPVSTFEANITSILSRPGTFHASAPILHRMQDGQLHSINIPLVNPLRDLACGRKVLNVPLVLYCDDSSGNVSKRWNKHISALMTLAGLPHRVQQQEFNIHFIGTSNLVSATELLEGVVEQLNNYWSNGIISYDDISGEELLLRPMVIVFEGDNPMQAEACSCSPSLGVSLKFCRVCKVGEEKKGDQLSETGITNFMKIGQARSMNETRAKAQEIHLLAANPRSKTGVINEQCKSGVRDPIVSHFAEELLQLAESMEDANASADNIQTRLKALQENQLSRKWHYNPLFDLQAFDCHQDTPFEILHGILLGFVKYFWQDSISGLSERQKILVSKRLSAADPNGLGCAAPRGETLVQYAQSLVGTDFRIIAQLAIFALYDPLSKPQLDAWIALGRLSRLLWRPSIFNINQFCMELETAIHHFLDMTALLSPQWFNKRKFHLLLHLPLHVRRFGPASSFATEKFESYNGIIRGMSIHSNRQAPSLDIARSFAAYSRVRHIFSGGFWKDKITGKWVQAGNGVRGLFRNLKVRLLLGLAIDMDTLEPRDRTGEIKVASQSKQTVKAKDTQLAQIPSSTHLNTSLSGNGASFTQFSHQLVSSVIVNRDEPIQVGSWVTTTALDDNGHPIIARVMEILKLEQRDGVATGPRTMLSILAHPHMVEFMHSHFHMPVLAPMSAELFPLPLDMIKVSINVQHACDLMLCGATGEAAVRQERQLSTKRKSIIEHQHNTTKDLWILNTNAFCNSDTTDPFCNPLLLDNRSEVITKSLERYKQLKEAEMKLSKARKSLQAGGGQILVDGIDISGLNYTDPTFDCSSPTIPQLRAILALYGVTAPKGKLKSFYTAQLTEKLAQEREHALEEQDRAEPEYGMQEGGAEEDMVSPLMTVGGACANELEELAPLQLWEESERGGHKRANRLLAAGHWLP
ncbi:hypothetical protein BT69DRAFT_1340646 [Atractiella rhizophila]|nr:hypothetical protein BT69DRAFT_1340646 [Atractiella rhizophila]